MNIRILSVILALFLTGGCATAIDNNVLGSIHATVGEVTLDGKKAEVGQVVKKDFVIQTAANSYCDIVFGKNAVRVVENSVFTYKLQDNARLLKVISGGIMSVMKEPVTDSNKQPPLHVETSTAIVAVRGTTFFVKALNEDNSYICDCNGVISVSDTSLQSTMELMANHHKGILVSRQTNGELNIADERDMFGHTDADMESVAALIDVKINWNDIDR